MVQSAKKILAIAKEALRWVAMAWLLEASIFSDVAIGVLVVKDVVPDTV